MNNYIRGFLCGYLRNYAAQGFYQGYIQKSAGADIGMLNQALSDRAGNAQANAEYRANPAGLIGADTASNSSDIQGLKAQGETLSSHDPEGYAIAPEHAQLYARASKMLPRSPEDEVWVRQAQQLATQKSRDAKWTADREARLTAEAKPEADYKARMLASDTGMPKPVVNDHSQQAAKQAPVVSTQRKGVSNEKQIADYNASKSKEYNRPKATGDLNPQQMAEFNARNTAGLKEHDARVAATNSGADQKFAAATQHINMNDMGGPQYASKAPAPAPVKNKPQVASTSKLSAGVSPL